MMNFLKKQQAKQIDFYLSVDILLALLANIYGLQKINWRITYEIYHIFFAMSCMLLIVDSCVVILIINIRKKIKYIQFMIYQ